MADPLIPDDVDLTAASAEEADAQAADETPTETPAETPAVEEAPAEEAPAAETPEPATPSAPAPVAAEPPKQPAETAAPVDPLDAEIADAEAAILADDYDPYSVEGRKALLRHSQAVARKEAAPLKQHVSEAQAIRQAEQVWAAESQKHGLERPQLETFWTDSIKEAQAEGYAAGDPRLQGAAEMLYRMKVKAAKGTTAAPAPAAAPATPKPTITKTGGSVLPRVNRHTPPAPVKKDAAEIVLETVGSVADWKV